MKVSHIAINICPAREDDFIFLFLQLLNMVAFIKIRIVRLASNANGELFFTLMIIEDRKRKIEHILSGGSLVVACESLHSRTGRQNVTRTYNRSG